MFLLLSLGLKAGVKNGIILWNYKDPRTGHLPMVANPLPVIAIIAAYLWIVLFWGPRFMANRKRMNLDRIMMVYNAVQVVWCAWLIKQCTKLGWWGKYNWLCEPLGDVVDDETMEAGFSVWMFLMLKIVDLSDTIFMILKKNFRQITFLHVYHHAGMVAATWFGTKLYPGGHPTFIGYLNCYVHVAMYSYYLLCILNPIYKEAWWKKYITLMQIVQFGINLVHQALPFFQPNCGVNRFICGVLFVQNLFMFWLFSEFYWKAYIKPQARKTDIKSS